MDDRVGQQLGNYQLLSKLGQGGFAEVYLGEHVHLGTQAAIKVLHTQLGESEIERFRNEARTIAHLEHPHIVRILDFGVDGTTPFLVMSYAQGGTLRTRHPKGTRLPLATVVSYAQQVASSLQHAHDRKMIHRDVKPENLLLGRSDEVLLSDFGIALIAQSSRHQSTQDFTGTVAYMSPEQIQGKPCLASDQYSLGTVVYEWLCGERPFYGSLPEICTQHMFASPPSLREKVPTLPPAVEQVVFTAIAKKPEQRFNSIQAFADALREATQILPDSGSLNPIAWSTEAMQAVDVLPLTQYPTQLLNSSPKGPSSNVGPPFPQKRRPGKRLPLIVGGALGLILLLTVLTVTIIAPAINAIVSPNTAQVLYNQATSGNPVFNDPLTSQSANNWFAVSTLDHGFDCAFTAESVHVSVQQYGLAACYALQTQFSNFAFQVQMTVIKGEGGGLLFRKNGSNSFGYRFFVGQKYYDLNYDDKRIASDLASFKIKLNQPYLLTAIARGSSISLYVDKQWLTTVTDQTTSSGTVGIMAWGKDSPAEVVYNNAKVWAL